MPGPGGRRLITPLPVDASGTIAVPPRADLRGGAVPAPPPMITGVLPASIMWHTGRDESPAAMIGLVGRSQGCDVDSSLGDLEYGTDL
jgi:hypothetical protein